ncbi:MAG: 50S ribosomal protein L10 [Candidatus Margulisbacteria bacterium GWF2_35_9]|nr:MAG: 50S ribosomal protein L10 [Candidatus Margulisbacteria bacterium GWF2_35_9]
MVKEVNKTLVGNLVDKFNDNNITYFIDYKGLTVEQITALRQSLKESNSELKIFKNTLALIALEEINKDLVEKTKEVFKGPTALIFSKNDPVGPAKALLAFMKKNDKVKIKGGILDNGFIGDNSVKELASLPSREVLISKVLMLLNSPITGFVSVLSGNIRSFVYTLNAIKDKKGL